MKFRPGVVPQWPSSRGLMCSRFSGFFSSGLSRDKSGRPKDSWPPASRRRSCERDLPSAVWMVVESCITFRCVCLKAENS